MSTYTEISSSNNYNSHSISQVFLDTGSKNIVVFCHGFRSSSIGPNKLFVDIARKLAVHNICSVRFDQYGSGNSEGDFLDSSFNDWQRTTIALCNEYINQGYKIALLGQSMGGATVLNVASHVLDIKATVSWVPDPNVETFITPESGVLEEGGQIIKSVFWQEAHDLNVADRIHLISTPLYIVQCSDDEYVSEENHEAIRSHARDDQLVEMYTGFKHSAWTAEQASIISTKTIDFITKQFMIE
jgi:esterase/lipase